MLSSWRERSTRHLARTVRQRLLWHCLQNVTYQVSTALTYGKWTLLGSPWDMSVRISGEAV